MKIKTLALITIGLLTLFTLKAHAQVSLEDGLVAYYPFNGNAVDATGNGHDGTVVGATPVEDRFGNPNSAYLFDGIDDEISLAMTELLASTPAGPHSYSVWVKKGPATGRSSFVLDASWPFGTGGDQRGIRFQSEGIPAFKWVTQTLSLVTFSMSPIELNQWEHLVGVFDGTEGRIYINGVMTGHLQTAGGAPTRVDRFKIGQVSAGGTGDGSFPGVIDDVRIYNRALTDNEIVALFEEDNCTFGPALGILEFERSKGKPVVEEVVWDSCGGDGFLMVQGEATKHATIWLNGTSILLPGDCAPSMQAIQLAVHLQEGVNFLQVRLTGKPGNKIELWFGE